MKCKNCNEEIHDKSKFCNQCGTKIEIQTKTCPNEDCKRTGLPQEALFCPDCGRKVSYSFENYIEVINGVSIEMVAIEGGTYIMGDDDGEYDNEKPAHKVTVSDFCISKLEVTQALWNAVMERNPSKFKGENLPVEQVNWYTCHEFLKKLGQKTGMEYRLPTEAEWEYAARGGDKSRAYKYSGSDDPDDVAWCRKNSSFKTHPVGMKQPNELGLYDMSGNVYELCNDWYGKDYYSSSPTDNPQGPSKGEFRVLRGGSSFDDDYILRCVDRRHTTQDAPDAPDYQNFLVGFRCVISR